MNDKYQEAFNIIKKGLLLKTNEKAYIIKLEVLQELINNYKCLHNEFCLRCGEYREAHLGKCDGCRWKQ